MTNRILALLDDEKIADQAAKAITNLGYEDVEWQFIHNNTTDVRIVPGVPAHTGPDTARPVGFIQDSDPPVEFTLDDLDLSQEEKDFFALGLERNAVVIVVDAPDEAIDAVERVLTEHNAGRFTEA
jgi:hypothetical protein